MLVLNSSSANTFGWLFQLGLGGALILFCTDSSFHRVRRDKAASSLLYHSHSKPFNCERSFNAVPLRGEKNNLKMVHFLANSHKITSQFKCGQPLKVQCFYLNKASLGFFSFFNWCLQNNHLKIWKLLQKVITTINCNTVILTFIFGAHCHVPSILNLGHFGSFGCNSMQCFLTITL